MGELSHGKAKQVEGAMQDFYGQAKDAAANAAEAVGDRASQADDFLRATIKQQPLWLSA